MLWVRSFVRCQASCVLELEAIQSRRNTFLMVTQLPLQVGNGVPAKTWKRSVTHVHVSHLIQVHLDKKGEGRPAHILHRSASGRLPVRRKMVSNMDRLALLLLQMFDFLRDHLFR
jgi:predicted ArsR family transcriptional regulator